MAGQLTTRDDVQDIVKEALEANFATFWAAMDQRFDAMEDRLTKRFDAIDDRLTKRFDAIDERFDAIGKHLAVLTAAAVPHRWHIPGGTVYHWRIDCGYIQRMTATLQVGDGGLDECVECRRLTEGRRRDGQPAP